MSDTDRRINELRSLMDDFVAGLIDPVDVSLADVRSVSSPQLDEIERVVFAADADAPMDANERAAFRLQWGSFRLVRLLGADDLTNLRYALGAVMVIVTTDPAYLRMRVALGLIDPAEAPEVTH